MIQLPSEIIKEINSYLILKDSFALVCVNRFVNESCHEENNKKILNMKQRCKEYEDERLCCYCYGCGEDGIDIYYGGEYSSKIVEFIGYSLERYASIYYDRIVYKRRKVYKDIRL